MLDSSTLPPRPQSRGVPTILDCLRIELEGVRKRGHTPIKLLVHGDCLPALCDIAKAEGDLNGNASPARILDLPLMMSSVLISAAEGARIVCEGDELHASIRRRREALLAGHTV